MLIGSSIGSIATATPVSTATPVGGGEGKIVFFSYIDGNDEIYVMDANGSNQTRLTNNNVADVYPVWSPDGTKIAFVSNRDGNYEIYVMDANGLNQTWLTNNSNYDGNPAWSPDGTKIAFDSDRNGNNEIYVLKFPFLI